MTDKHGGDKTVRVAVALSRAVALSEELQATVMELAETLRSSGIPDHEHNPTGEKRK